MKKIICQRCGVEFSANTLRRKLCDECRVISYKELRREARKRRNESVTIRVSADTEEMRNCCLNCKKAKCGGECAELARIAKRGSNDN